MKLFVGVRKYVTFHCLEFWSNYLVVPCNQSREQNSSCTRKHVMLIQKVLSSNKYKRVVPIILIPMDNICSPASNSIYKVCVAYILIPEMTKARNHIDDKVGRWTRKKLPCTCIYLLARCTLCYYYNNHWRSLYYPLEMFLWHINMN